MGFQLLRRGMKIGSKRLGLFDVDSNLPSNEPSITKRPVQDYLHVLGAALLLELPSQALP